MEASSSPALMLRLPRPGQQVRWRDPSHARAVGWMAALGPGPFAVVRVGYNGGQAPPLGVVVHTNLGEREVNEVWLEVTSAALAGTGGQPPGA